MTKNLGYWVATLGMAGCGAVAGWYVGVVCDAAVLGAGLGALGAVWMFCYIVRPPRI